MLLVMGAARLGTAIKFIPYPVTMGFTSGIAVQLIAQLYSRGGFDLVLAAIALTGFIMMAGWLHHHDAIM